MDRYTSWKAETPKIYSTGFVSEPTKIRICSCQLSNRALPGLLCVLCCLRAETEQLRHLPAFSVTMEFSCDHHFNHFLGGLSVVSAITHSLHTHCPPPVGRHHKCLVARWPVDFRQWPPVTSNHVCELVRAYIHGFQWRNGTTIDVTLIFAIIHSVR